MDRSAEYSVDIGGGNTKEHEFHTGDGAYVTTDSRGTVEMQNVGITEDPLLDELLSRVIVTENREAPFGRGAHQLYKGDRFLSENDWQTAEHKASISRYTGEPKPVLTIKQKFQQYQQWRSARSGIPEEQVPRVSQDVVLYGIE